jgi:hypothetical protein
MYAVRASFAGFSYQVCDVIMYSPVLVAPLSVGCVSLDKLMASLVDAVTAVRVRVQQSAQCAQLCGCVAEPLCISFEGPCAESRHGCCVLMLGLPGAEGLNPESMGIVLYMVCRGCNAVHCEAWTVAELQPAACLQYNVRCSSRVPC